MVAQPTLRIGSHGSDTADLQRLLIGKGFTVGRWGPDGVFGHGTDTAVRRYQSRVGLVADGIVGPRTWAALTAGGTSTAARVADRAYRLLTGGHGYSVRYVFGAEVALSSTNPRAIDCSEAVQWAVYQETHRDWVDGSRFQYAAGNACSVGSGIATKGALLFLSSGGIGGIHHVAFSMGNGRTAEARSAALGCGSWSAHGRGWDYACRVPILRY